MIILNNPLDMHVHLREKELLSLVLESTSRPFVAALAMPNLSSPIINTKMALSYREEILSHCKDSSFTPIMSLYLSEKLNTNELLEAKQNGINIIKLYPKDITTLSQHGVENILSENMFRIFEIMQEMGFILCVHAESNGFVMEREFEFHNTLKIILQNFPSLKIVMEHLSDRRSINLIEKYENLFATLTLHHITLSLDDVAGGALNYNYFCKPLLKTPKDRDALLEAALNAHPKISFGSDSAPHFESNKLKGAAGIFSAPILLPALCELFESKNRLENLQKFISDNAFRIYNLKNLPSKKIKLEKRPLKVNKIANENDFIIPMYCNKTISWNYAKDSY